MLVPIHFSNSGKKPLQSPKAMTVHAFFVCMDDLDSAFKMILKTPSTWHVKSSICVPYIPKISFFSGAIHEFHKQHTVVVYTKHKCS